MSDTLLHKLTEDLDYFARTLNIVLTNERDMQIHIALHLRQQKYYDAVEVEYAIPLEIIGYYKPYSKTSNFEGSKHNFPWPNDIYADIVVVKDNQYAIVELKYGTRNIVEPINTTRFSKSFDTKINIVKTQGAHDITMYNYCKNIRRIEHLSEKFPNLVGGVALLITNDYLYWTKPTKSVAYDNFSLHDGNTIQKVEWRKSFSENVRASHPNFYLSSSYTCQWHDTARDHTNGEGKNRKKDIYFGIS